MHRVFLNCVPTKLNSNLKQRSYCQIKASPIIVEKSDFLECCYFWDGKFRIGRDKPIDLKVLFLQSRRGLYVPNWVTGYRLLNETLPDRQFSRKVIPKMVAKCDESMQMKLREYMIVGRAAPSPKKPEPKVYRMRLFAKNPVLAKSKFWYFMSKINKAKKTGGEVLNVTTLAEKNPNSVKNFAIWLRYDSRTGTHNMYKEFRDLSRAGAVSQMYSDMTGRHRALHSSIQIMRVAEIPASLCKRPHITQLVKPGLKFPLVKNMPLKPRSFKKTFSASRPSIFHK